MVGCNPYTGLANRRYRPLSHLSNTKAANSLCRIPGKCRILGVPLTVPVCPLPLVASYFVPDQPSRAVRPGDVSGQTDRFLERTGRGHRPLWCVAGSASVCITRTGSLAFGRFTDTAIRAHGWSDCQQAWSGPQGTLMVSPERKEARRRHVVEAHHLAMLLVRGTDVQ